MEKKEKILIVHNYYQIPGGEDTVVMNEKNMLEGCGHEVILYTRNNSELKTMGIIRKMLLPFTTIFNFRTYREVRRIIKEEKIDIVHVHNTLNLVSPAVYYASLSKGIPVVQTIHNFRLLCPGATFYRDGHICEDCVKYGLRCAIRHSCYRESKIQTLVCVVNTIFHRLTGVYGKINYICLTEFNKKKLLELKQIREDKVFIKPNFVEQDCNFIPEKQRENQYVFAGRLDKLKGIDLLLNIWERMGENAPKLIICGTGPLEKWCQEFISNNNVNAELMGHVPNSETKKIIGKSKALILPTKWYEGFPMTIVEAYSVGTPVICSDIGNVGDVVKERITGYKFNCNSQEQLIGKLSEIYKTNLDELGNNAYEEWKKKYSLTGNYRILKSIYEKVKIDKK